MNWKDTFLKLADGDRADAWDYVTALRGSDISPHNEVDIAKLFLTVSLRGVCSQAMDHHDIWDLLRSLNSSEDLVGLIKTLFGQLKVLPEHYIYHVKRGWAAIGEPAISMVIMGKLDRGTGKDCRTWELVWRVNNFIRRSIEEENKVKICFLK